MKNILLTLSFFFGFLFNSFSQTLINRTSVDTLGRAISYYNLFTGTNAEDGHVILAGNGYLTSSYESFFIAKYSLDTGLVWMADLTPQPAGKRQFGTDVYFKKGFVYGAAFTWDSASGKAAINAIKIDNATGDTIWTTSYTGSYNGYNVPSSIVVDSSGNVFIAGTEQTGALDFKMIVIKYDNSGAQQWVADYDSVGLYDGAVAAELTNTRVNITGFSGNGFGSWDFVQGSYLKSNGSVQQIRRHGNGAGDFSHPIGLGKDLWSNIYVGGTAAFGNGKTGIKILSYDTSFALIYAKRMGDTSQNCEAVAMETDIWGNVTIIGTQDKSNGGKDIITAKYDTSGTQLWLRTISAPDPTKEAKAGDIALQDLSGGNLYITGNMSNGTNTDVVTFSYDTDGNMRWLKTFSREGNYNDAGTLVLNDENFVQVALTSYGSDSLLMGVTYEEWEKEIEVVTTDTNGLYAKNRVLVRFNRNAVIEDKLCNTEIKYGAPSDFLTEAALDSINTVYALHERCRLTRLTDITPLDTVSVTRLGTEVRVPPLWTAFALDYDDESTSEVELSELLSELSNTVIYSHPDYVGHFDSGANDTIYPTQASFHPVAFFDSADINIEPAWNYGGGLPFVKVGVIDDGIDYNNADLGGGAGVRVKGGRDYTTSGSSIFTSPNGTGSHGTKVAGILGATRNNTTAMAGIAGGDGSSPGSSLYGFRITQGDTQLLVSNMYAAITENAIFNAAHPNNSFWGLNIMNISMGFDYSFGINTTANILLLQDAVHFANRNQVTIVASRGNNVGTNVHYPACHPAPFVIGVGATGNDGRLAINFNTSGCPSANTGYSSGLGQRTDILAPGSRCISPSINTGTTLTTGFSGTSAAAPHVAGVAALLMSHYNADTPNIGNLAPEDVTAIVQLSAKSYSGFNNNIAASGRLNAGAAFDLVWKPKHKIEHFISVGADTVIPESYQTLSVPFRVENHYGELIDPNTFYAKRFDLYKTFYVPQNQWRIITMWPVHSLSDVITAELNSTILSPFEQLNCCDVLSGDALVPVSSGGNVWLIRDTIANKQWWYPYDTTYARDSAVFALSVLYNDTGVTSIKDQEVKNFGISADVYPNPSQNGNVIVLYAEKPMEIQIDLYDVIGRLVRNVYTGEIYAGDNRINNTLIDLTGGTYFYYIHNKERKLSKKFIKLR